MKKYMLTWLLVILAGASSLMVSSHQSEQHFVHSMDEPALSAVDTISDTEAVTVSALTILERSPVKCLFPLNDYALIFRGGSMPLKPIFHVKTSAETSGFISAVYHQSNYLS
jgi:hypothetical protein